MNAKILAPALGIALGLCFVPSAWAQQPEKETNCSDRIDEDGDTVTDCADADCYDDPVCKTAGGLENNNVLCSDWIDNDGDGAVDCEDVDCNGPGITACQGSWQGPLTGTGATPAPGTGPADGATSSGELPVLGEGQSVEDLLGTGSDADGERNDFVCSDGFDNDGDGAIDWPDDPECTAAGGLDEDRRCPALGAELRLPAEGGEVDVDTRGLANVLRGSCGGGGAPEVAVTLHLDAPARVVAEVVAADYDTLVYIIDRCDDRRDEAGCDDDSGDGNWSRVETRLDAGDWVIVVDGFGQNSGTATLRVDVVPEAMP